MNCESYQESVDLVWSILLHHNITALPIKISAIVKREGIILSSYSKANDFIKMLGFLDSTVNNDGFSVRIGKNYYIFYNDQCSPQRARFTIAHELGHILRGDVGTRPTCRNREPTDQDNDMETQANIISSRLLAPACVLWALDIHSAYDIATLCDVSLESAKWRSKRMNLLYDREKEFIATRGKSCFLLSPKERAVYNQFLPFINEVKDRYRRC